MGKISVILGIIIGIIFSVAFPEVAQTINDAIMPTIQSISEKMINWITAQSVSLVTDKDSYLKFLEKYHDKN